MSDPIVRYSALLKIIDEARGLIARTLAPRDQRLAALEAQIGALSERQTHMARRLAKLDGKE